MLIDAHAHVMPGSFPVAPAGCDPAAWPRMEAAEAGARVLASGPMRFTARAVWFDAEQRLAASAVSGVDAEVVSPFPPLLNYTLRAGFRPHLRPGHGAAAGSRSGRRGAFRARRPRAGRGGDRVPCGRGVAGRPQVPRVLRGGRTA